MANPVLRLGLAEVPTIELPWLTDAIELSPAYVDVAVLRWQAFTGLQATLDGSETFDALAKKRTKKKAA